MFKTKSNLTQLNRDINKMGKKILAPFEMPIKGLIYQNQDLKNPKSGTLTTKYSIKLEFDEASKYYKQILFPMNQFIKPIFIAEMNKNMSKNRPFSRELVDEAVERTMDKLYSRLYPSTPIDTGAFRDSWQVEVLEGNYGRLWR